VIRFELNWMKLVRTGLQTADTADYFGHDDDGATNASQITLITDIAADETVTSAAPTAAVTLCSVDDEDDAGDPCTREIATTEEACTYFDCEWSDLVEAHQGEAEVGGADDKWWTIRAVNSNATQAAMEAAPHQNPGGRNKHHHSHSHSSSSNHSLSQKPGSAPFPSSKKKKSPGGGGGSGPGGGGGSGGGSMIRKEVAANKAPLPAFPPVPRRLNTPHKVVRRKKVTTPKR
jgi:uncharacterized membrane protein YgcG